jgi:hypothetical protein
MAMSGLAWRRRLEAQVRPVSPNIMLMIPEAMFPDRIGM